MGKKQQPFSNVSFGFETVPEAEKTQRVRSLFNRVASRYDIMNDAMSLGVHRYWKHALVQSLSPRQGMTILDMAGGTGDIAFRILDKCPSAQVTVCDMTLGMLSQGQIKGWNRGFLKALTWVCGNAEALPWPDQSYDAYTIAFGLRNITDPMQALREAHRILKPGGRLLCLEFSKLQSGVLNTLYKTYSFQLIPYLGRIIANDQQAYQYLVESIERFFDQETLREMIRQSGFETVSYQNYMGGIAALHTAGRAL